ncbi:hypothetical protein [Bosea lathyri]|jgi:hypothetical protein|uniref:Uncharacterized protein n=1 Tax=Bosea lathyri TaxID=1036778 RepID=A0A1H6CTI7_9HYPH|nr:hypothetical protein [Bosea lathyri]SEG76379.1 hypothetical protein SAMN04488115_112104 [Bosea lathyri]
MDLIVRLFLRLGVLLQPPMSHHVLRPIPIPVRNQRPRLPGGLR